MLEMCLLFNYCIVATLKLLFKKIIERSSGGYWHKSGKLFLELNPEENFETPVALVTYSDKGLTGVSHESQNLY